MSTIDPRNVHSCPVTYGPNLNSKRDVGRASATASSSLDAVPSGRTCVTVVYSSAARPY
jgi:hypothetical protein